MLKMTWKTNIYKHITAKIYRIAWKVEVLSKYIKVLHVYWGRVSLFMPVKQILSQEKV
jgi:hypothetical protein